MRIIIPAILAGLLIAAVGFTGCVSERPSGAAEAEKTIAQTIAPESLRYLTEEYPPFNYLENGSARGVSVELLKEITRRTGDPVTDEGIRFLPWSEAYRTALEEKNTVVFSTGRLPEREPLFLWVGPIHSYEDVLFARKDRDIVVRGPEDLGDYRIGVIADTAPLFELRAIGVNETSLVTAADAPALVRMLRDGEIDLWSDSEPAGWYFFEQVTGDPGIFEVVYTLEGHELYYAFNRNTTEALIGPFRDAYRAAVSEKDATGVSAYERIVYRYLPVSCARETITGKAVVDLVNYTAAEVEKDSAGTFQKINAGSRPFRNKDTPALYAFVYDTNVTIVAHADNPTLIGVNLRGKTDVTGKPMRDLMVSGALANGTHWEDYLYTSPQESGLYRKTSYCRLTEGSDGNRYIVCSGKYETC
ncbi:MAG: transporter substrate-binding domain-containing protein [Methanomicrobiales archaeon]|nr:transporter substrate-binding domain-containing protein [Methanomicrobiales archaeon]